MGKTILVIGAHPDDPDTSAGGLSAKLAQRGWKVRFLSLTDGSSGHYAMGGAELAARRFEEAQNSGAVIGAQYDIMGLPDGRLEATIENREKLIAYIRQLAPDVIITNRICDYHADHRATALLVQDASYLLTVPNICKSAPYMRKMPLIMFWHDGFLRPAPFTADVVVPIEKYIDKVAAMAACHKSQYFEWMLWHENEEQIALPEEQKRADLQRRFKAAAERMGQQYGLPAAEVYEVSEYGGDLTAELKRELEE